MVGMFAWTARQYPELMSFAGIGSEERTAGGCGKCGENDVDRGFRN
jgi:hypothetical protein